MSRRAGTPTAKKVTQLVNVEEHVEEVPPGQRRIGASLLMITLS